MGSVGHYLEGRDGGDEGSMDEETKLKTEEAESETEEWCGEEG